MSAPVIAALGTAFGGAGAATLGLIGSVVAGVGGAIMESKRDKEEREAEIAAEKRREARYQGVGDATRVRDEEQNAENPDPTVASGVTRQRVDPHKQSSTPLGFREVTERVGGTPSSTPTQPKTTRYSYDPNAQRVVPA